MRVIIRPTSRMVWAKQPPPPYVRGKVEKHGGWIIDHENRTINADPEWAGQNRNASDLSRVLHELDRLENFPENVPYTCESAALRG